ncbi:hypothetical protein Hanom_Chr09g00776451 [Helianthus anomalus]
MTLNKNCFYDGGYDDIERARAYHPVDMPNENWKRTIDHFLDLKYIARCEANAKVRQRQLFPNRGGQRHTVALPTNMFKTYRYVPQNHTDKDENWVDAVAEQNFIQLNLECEIMGREGGGSQPPNKVVAFQNVLGDRRGWLREIRHKPSSNMSSNVFVAQPQTPQSFF